MIPKFEDKAPLIGGLKQCPNTKALARPLAHEAELAFKPTEDRLLKSCRKITRAKAQSLLRFTPAFIGDIAPLRVFGICYPLLS